MGAKRTTYPSTAGGKTGLRARRTRENAALRGQVYDATPKAVRRQRKIEQGWVEGAYGSWYKPAKQTKKKR